MSRVYIESSAFRRAELESERLRIACILSFIALFVVVTVIRVFVARTSTEFSGFVVAGVVVGYELWILYRVDLCLKTECYFPMGFWTVSTIIETSMPAVVLAFFSSSTDNAFRPVANPVILVFFIFIILSVLRLSPWLGILSGLVASLSYLGAAIHLGWRPPLPGMPAQVTQYGVSLNSITLMGGGLLAGAVARQIRTHVTAALREAETKRQLDAVRHDLQVARSIQQSLLPQNKPSIEGFEIAGWNRPADDTGGDYFDWTPSPNGKVIVSLADVTGHGIGPALLAALCHAYSRSSFNSLQNLSTALKRINQDLAVDLGAGRLITFVAAACCPGCTDVEILSAGHGPIFTYSREKDQFSEIKTHALPFGVLPDLRPDPSTNLTLGSGDLLVLATDGFFEWENDQGEQFGLSRMEAVIRADRDATPSVMIDRLYETVCAFANGTKQQDDLTAVIIKRL